jgi:hypothetical protein
MTRHFCVVTIALCYLCFSSFNAASGKMQTASPTPAASSTPTNPDVKKGQQIGTIISSAIDTAFPVIGKVMDLFKGGKKSASKDEVAQASTDAQKQFMSTVKQKIQPAATVAKELAVLQAFATAAVNAHDNVLTINHLLEASTPNYDQVDTEWTIAKNYLADVITIKTADIQIVADPNIQLRLLDLQNSRRDLMVRIDRNVALGKGGKPLNKADLQTQMAAMSDLLKGLNSLAAIELATLQADIDNLAKWANGAAGPQGTPKPNVGLLRIADHAVSSAKKALASTGPTE